MQAINHHESSEKILRFAPRILDHPAKDHRQSSLIRRNRKLYGNKSRTGSAGCESSLPVATKEFKNSVSDR